MKGGNVRPPESPKKCGERRARCRTRGRPPAPRDGEAQREESSSCLFTGNKRSAQQMELSDSISTGGFLFYCRGFAALFSPEQKESIARHVRGSAHAVMFPKAEEKRALTRNLAGRLSLTVRGSALLRVPLVAASTCVTDRKKPPVKTPFSRVTKAPRQPISAQCI